jgi:flagellar motor protein MotB
VRLAGRGERPPHSTDDEAAGRMTADGYGNTRLLADTGTDQGRAQHRRVELVKK